MYPRIFKKIVSIRLSPVLVLFGMADLMLTPSFCRPIFPLLAAIPDDVNTILEAPFRVDDDGKGFRLSISSATKYERNCNHHQIGLSLSAIKYK